MMLQGHAESGVGHQRDNQGQGQAEGAEQDLDQGQVKARGKNTLEGLHYIFIELLVCSTSVPTMGDD